MRIGLGQVSATTPQTYLGGYKAAAQDVLLGGEAVGSPIYNINLSAAKTAPGFNQAQFDTYWNALTVGGTGYNAAVADSANVPAFVKYAGSAPSNVVLTLQRSGMPIPAAYQQAARGGVVGAGGTGGSSTTDPNGFRGRGVTLANRPNNPPFPGPVAPSDSEHVSGWLSPTTTYVDPGTGSVWKWNGANWVNISPGWGPPVVVNPSPPSQPTNTGTSITSPGSALSVANGATLTTTTSTDPSQIIPGVPNTVLFIGAGGLVLLLFAMGKK